MADGHELIETPNAEVAPYDGDPKFGMLLEATRLGLDAEKFRMFLDMKREEEDRDARRAFNQAYVAAKREIQPIFRNKHNDQTSSNYADAYALADQVDPILSKHGLAPTFGMEPCERDGFYRMVCDLLHEDGYEKRYTADIPIDAAGIKGSRNKTDTHAFGSSTTYGRRYMKMSIFDLATRDDDGNAAAKRDRISETQVEYLNDLLQDSKSDLPAFLKYMNAESVEDITIKGFDGATKMLRKKIVDAEKSEA